MCLCKLHNFILNNKNASNTCSNIHTQSALDQIYIVNHEGDIQISEDEIPSGLLSEHTDVSDERSIPRGSIFVH